MSFLVLHMDKFKKEAVRGIQSHNLRERKSHSNPDIDYQRSVGNYELLEGASGDYASAVQNRIDDLLLTKAIRKDAVHMCGLIVSSDREFFMKLSPEETRHFFEESKAFLAEFVGKENVISAMVHMDEKTPHMHFLHVPVTKDGRLNANSIYTRESLKILQTEFHRHLHSKGFAIQRGVEQEPGSKKKHLNTREFKQQQEALSSLQAESVELVRDALNFVGKMGALREQEAALQERLQVYEAQAQEAENMLQEGTDIPEASVFSFKAALEKARQIIEMQNQALATKRVHADKVQRLEAEVATLQDKFKTLKAETLQRHHCDAEHARGLRERLATMQDQLAEVRQFLEQPEVAALHNRFRAEQQAEQERRAREAEEQRQAQAQAVREAQRQAEHQAKHQATAPSHAPQPSAFRGMRP